MDWANGQNINNSEKKWILIGPLRLVCSTPGQYACYVYNHNIQTSPIKSFLYETSMGQEDHCKHK